MSKKIKAQINCPKCSQRFTVELYRSIWVEIPGNLKLVLNDEINRFSCPSCAFTFNVDFPFLCTNVKKRFALWYEPRHDDEIDKDVEKYRVAMGGDSFYAKAPRIKAWNEFKNKLLELDSKKQDKNKIRNPRVTENKKIYINNKSLLSIFIDFITTSSIKAKIFLSAKLSAFIVISYFSLSAVLAIQEWKHEFNNYDSWISGPKQRCEKIFAQAREKSFYKLKESCTKPARENIDGYNLEGIPDDCDYIANANSYDNAPHDADFYPNTFSIMKEIGGEDCLKKTTEDTWYSLNTKEEMVTYPEPQPLASAMKETFNIRFFSQAIFINLVIGVFLLILFDSASRVILETRLGWKRLWLVISSFVFITIFFIKTDGAGDHSESIFQATLAAIVSSLALIYGKLLFTWVATGFREDAKNSSITNTIKTDELAKIDPIKAPSPIEAQTEDALQENIEPYLLSEMMPETIKTTADINTNSSESSLDNQYSIDTSSESVTETIHPSENKIKKKELKGVWGWLLLFCVYLVIIHPIVFLGQISNAYLDATLHPEVFALYPSIKIAATFEKYATAAIVIYGFFAGISIWSGRQNGRKNAKWYLQSNIVIAAVTICVMLWLTKDLPKDIHPSIIGASIGKFIREIAFFAICWLYFKKSSRVKNTYGDEN